MTNRLDTTQELPACNVTREMIYDLIRTAKPKADMVNSTCLQVVDDQIDVLLNVPRWRKFTVSFADVEDNALSKQAALFTLPARGVIHAVKIKHSTAFAGTGISAATVSVGTALDSDKYASPFNVYQAAGATVFQYSGTEVADTHDTAGVGVVAEVVVVGANLDQLTAGSADVWVLYSVTI